jgi:cytochrome c oxidase assembly protein subunit 15
MCGGKNKNWWYHLDKEDVMLSTKIFDRMGQRVFRYLLIVSTLIMFLLIVVGGMVRVTGSGGSCPDWPTCLGQWTPPAVQGAALEYLHRGLSIVAALALLISAGVAWKTQRHERWVMYAFGGSLALMAVQIVLGRLVTLPEMAGVRSWLSVFHLGLSLGALALVLLPTVLAFYPLPEAGQPHTLNFRSGFARLSLATLAALFVLLVSGAVVAGSQARLACATWPLCNGLFLPVNGLQWISLVHRRIVALSGGLMAACCCAWRSQAPSRAILVSTSAAAVLFLPRR